MPDSAADIRPVVVLVGPPGSGKTTVGQELAALLAVSLRDTDAEIEKAAGRTISDIFVTDGELVFREMERTAVLRGLREHAGVLALGGGAVLSAATREALRGHAVAFLSLSMPVGVKRTGMATNRPLLVGVNPRATYKSLLDARLPLYREVAALEIDTDQLTADQVAARIVEQLQLMTTTDPTAGGNS